jgi:peptide/nickel transport system substrate-binding protein
VKTRTLTGNAWFQTLGNGDWDAMPLSALGSVNPSMLVALVSGAAPPKGSNYVRITNPEYDAATKTALNAESVEEACEHWNAAERELYEQANIFPLVEADRLFAMQKHVDIEANVYGVVPTSVRLHEG